MEYVRYFKVSFYYFLDKQGQIFVQLGLILSMYNIVINYFTGYYTVFTMSSGMLSFTGEY